MIGITIEQSCFIRLEVVICFEESQLFSFALRFWPV